MCLKGKDSEVTCPRQLPPLFIRFVAILQKVFIAFTKALIIQISVAVVVQAFPDTSTELERHQLLELFQILLQAVAQHDDLTALVWSRTPSRRQASRAPAQPLVPASPSWQECEELNQPRYLP